MRVAVYLIPSRNNKVLLSRRFNTGYHDGEYSLVAGHLDGGETLAQAMIREAKEEADIDIHEKDLKIVHTQHRICHDVEYIDFHLTTEKWAGEPKVMEANKCDDLRWFPVDDLPQNTIPYIRTVFENIAARIPFSEWKESNA